MQANGTTLFLPRTQTSLSMCAQRKAGKNEAPEEEADSFPYLEKRGREVLQIFLRDGGGESRIV